VTLTALAQLTLVIALAGGAPQQHDHAAAADDRPVTLVEGMTGVHHAIQTRSQDAQKFFDQGLAFVYAFNHEEAVRSFRRAAELDPSSPMPWWGIALALGPNINQDIDPDREKAAYDAVQQALKRAGSAPAGEKAYVAALVKRYSNQPQADVKALAVDYKDAMRAVMRMYPDDPDAATLYAESLMDLHPWQLYSNDGSPGEGTPEIVDVLEGVLRRHPDHVGANHYYIHATEASLAPERALASARRLETLVPAAGHLVHMPAHTYMRTGNYAGAVTANAKAADVDRRYIAETHADGFYPTTYYNHNLDFLASAAMMTGQFSEAARAADELVNNVQPAIAAMPMLEGFGAKKLYVLLRFAKWSDVLELPAPAPGAALLTTLYHFGRGVAHAKLGAAGDAAADRDAFRLVRSRVPADAMAGLNPASAILAVAEAVLDARIAAANGDMPVALAAWQKAVAAEDAVAYDEPADWFYPTRESLGIAYLQAGRPDDARRTFREDLERNPQNPRSTFGLWQAYRTTEPNSPMTQILRLRFTTAWADADVELNLADF